MKHNIFIITLLLFLLGVVCRKEKGEKRPEIEPPADEWVGDTLVPLNYEI